MELCADEELVLGMFRSTEAKATVTRKVAAEQGVGDCALVPIGRSDDPKARHNTTYLNIKAATHVVAAAERAHR